MKRVILLASLVLGGVLNAQSNEQLAEKLKNERNQKNLQLDFYLSRDISEFNVLSKNDNPKDGKEEQPSLILASEIKKQIVDNKHNISFFFNGEPYFIAPTDTDQISNANVDAIHNGTINGLNGNFRGQDIKISVFDGGRVYTAHSDLQSTAGTPRVSNKEAETVPYSSHATAVTGMIGSTGTNIGNSQISGNTRGMAPLATFDSYSFSDTILPGETETKTSAQKLLGSLASLSNHSYGGVIGWSYVSTASGLRYWRWNGLYDPTTQQSYDLNGTYHINDRDYDNIVYNNPSMIVVKSAGNSFGEGPTGSPVNFGVYSHNGRLFLFDDTDILPENNCSQGYDCIPSGSVAKNLIIVGATEKITSNDKRYVQASDVIKADYSSAGPRDDGAIKPDIAGVGSDIFSPSTSPAGSNTWSYGSGTSYSAPQVTGIMGLWLEIYKKLNNNKMFDAASAKTLLIHTAMEAGNVGPDVHFGWGFVNAQAGAELIVKKNENKIIFAEKTLANKEKETIYLKSNGKEPLKVSISWIDPSYKVIHTTYVEANNDRASKLVNDFDLRITNIKTNEVFYPWKLDVNNPMAPAIKGDNLVDNVEQVLIEKPTAGVYKVEISHKGDLIDNNGNSANSQNYSIIATGYEDIIAPELIPNLIDPSDVVVYPTLLSDVESETTIHHLDKNIESVGVYDMNGRQFHSEKVNAKEHKLNFSKYATGVYIINIKLSNSRETITRKVIKK